MLLPRVLVLSAMSSLASSFVITSPLKIGALPQELDQLMQRASEQWFQERANGGPPTTCSNYDLSAAKPDLGTLPPPSPGLSVYHVALGRGVQNYTCANNSAIPTAKGAVATLFNVSCAAWWDTQKGVDFLGPLVQMAYKSNDPLPQQGAWGPLVSPQTMVSGHHYFSDDTTPTFNMVVNNAQPLPGQGIDHESNYGIYFSKKNASVTAAGTVGDQPSAGTNGEPAVAWLKLEVSTPPPLPYQVLAADAGPAHEVYRLNTIGGNANAVSDCANRAQGEVFSVPYAAEYWFFG